MADGSSTQSTGAAPVVGASGSAVALQFRSPCRINKLVDRDEAKQPCRPDKIVDLLTRWQTRSMSKPFDRVGHVVAFLVCLGGAWIACSLAAMGQDSDGLKERLLREGPPRWQEYMDRVATSAGSLSVHSSQSIDGLDQQNKLEFRTSDGCKLLRIVAKVARGGKVEEEYEEAHGLNVQYAFSVRRNKPDAPWVLTGLAGVQETGVIESVDKHFNDYRAAATMPVRLNSEPLGTALANDGFRIRHCKIVPQLGEELVEVQFEYQRRDRGSGERKEQGSLRLDPQRSWCLRAYDLEAVTAQGRVVVKYRTLDFDDAAAPVSVPRVYELDMDWVGQNGRQNRHKLRWEFTMEREIPAPSASEFTLAAFGLPEPPPLKTPTPWYLWTGIAAITCVGVGMILRHFKHRLQRSALSSGQ